MEVNRMQRSTITISSSLKYQIRTEPIRKQETPLEQKHSLARADVNVSREGEEFKGCSTTNHQGAVVAQLVTIVIFPS